MEILEPTNKRVAVELIGPDEARVLLKKVTLCRGSDPYWVTRFADEMRRGRWKLAESLMVDDELGVANGRRRLEAVVESGCEIEFQVIRGKFGFQGECVSHEISSEIVDVEDESVARDITYLELKETSGTSE